MASRLPEQAYEQVVANSLSQRLRTTQDYFQELRAGARDELAELLDLSPADRRMRIHRATKRFRNPILVDLLIAESRSRASRNPRTALDLAECAHDVAMRLPHEPLGSAWAMTCVARSLAYRGNALRAMGQPQAAASLLDMAFPLFEEKGTGDPMISGELVSLLASLRHDQRRFAEAESLIEHALSVYEQIGDLPQMARTLIKKGRVLAEVMRTDEAIEVTERAASLLEPREQPQLFLNAQHNLCVYLEDQGRYGEARQRMHDLADLYKEFADPWTQLRFRWNLGTIARGMGELEEAAGHLAAVRAGFLGEGQGYDAALAGLDLAWVFVQQGRTAEVRGLAEEMLPIFLAENIHREAVTALMLFQEAARREVVTVKMLSELSGFLRKVRQRPSEQAS